MVVRCDLLKIRYLCGRNDNWLVAPSNICTVVICSKFAIFAVEMTTCNVSIIFKISCDLLKIRYLCGRNDNSESFVVPNISVVICSKFAIFAVEMTTIDKKEKMQNGCDLLKIRYLCGRNDNI